MTQAINLANFANNLDAAGGVSPNALNIPVPLAKGGTNAVSASTARASLGLAIGTNVPSPTGVGASGNWAIGASSLATTTWTITEVSGVIYFAASGVNKAKLDTTGTLTVVGDVVAFGTI